jgi:hypothetical protein
MSADLDRRALAGCLDDVERALAGLEHVDDAATRSYIAMVRAETQCLRYHLLADVPEAADGAIPAA